MSLLANLVLFSAGIYVATNPGAMSHLRSFVKPSRILPNENTDHLARESLFEAMARPAPGSSIVFLGDSLTEYCEWTELLGIQVMNRGIAGDTTADVLGRLDAVLALRPKTVLLMSGTNDALLGVDLDVAAANYLEIVRRIHASDPSTVIFAESVPPVLPSSPMFKQSGRRSGIEVNEYVQSMNRRIQSLARDNSVTYIDLFDDLAAGGKLKPDYTVDGVHLSGHGYEVWKRRILPLLEGGDSAAHR